MIINIFDGVFCLVLGISVLYLFFFAVCAACSHSAPFPTAKRLRKFVTLIPAYKADAVIVQTTKSALNQDYPTDLHRVVVIADQIKPETLHLLQSLPITLLEVNFKNSSKAKALTYAVDTLGADAAEVVTIIDADNLVDREYIAALNKTFDAGMNAVQTHRTAKNRDTDIAVLDAASEEINNSILRRGHIAIGLSSALIGSGMAFRYDWFTKNIRCCTTSGEDKELEAMLLEQKVYIDYLEDVYVRDEKIQAADAYYNQRRRWIAAQFNILGTALRKMPAAIRSGNIDYLDKLVQWCMPPRMLLLAGVPLWTIFMTIADPVASIKWWVMTFLLFLALAIALPDEQADRKLAYALRRIPLLVLLTLGNLFRLGGVKDKFIHTQHTGAGISTQNDHPKP